MTRQLSRKESEALSLIVARLHQQFSDLAEEQVLSAVLARYSGFDGAPIRDFVPILVERSAREDLRKTVAGEQF